MSDLNQTADSSRNEEFSALFGHMIMQQANMAMMLMGKVARPDTGEIKKDLEAARYFIDQLEMLEAKTRGNLSKEESGLLKQTLMSCRLTYVEAVEEPDTAATANAAAPKPEDAKAPAPAAEPAPEPATTAEDESRKKFSKKY
jgi:acyl-coenzyme A thioesterase PaaI-like protein